MNWHANPLDALDLWLELWLDNDMSTTQHDSMTDPAKFQQFKRNVRHEYEAIKAHRPRLTDNGPVTIQTFVTHPA